MRRALLILAIATSAALPAPAQWTIQQANTTASLRGIHALGDGIAWASGTQGTVLHTTDDGATWQTCTTPPGAEKLDFRGIQAFDKNTAIVMSSGKGDLSRLYKTTDACKTWRLLLTNPDRDGFWDAIQFEAVSTNKEAPKCTGVVLGDPVKLTFVLLLTDDCGEHWVTQVRQPIQALKDEGIFAASNTSLALGGPDEPGRQTFVTGGPNGARVISLAANNNALPLAYPAFNTRPNPAIARSWHWDILPANKPTDSGGAFSYAHITVPGTKQQHTVIVGGNYKLPNDPNDTAWYLADDKWTPATTPPHGYRSAVAYDPATKSWITVGPNGADLSTDNGKNWRALKPSASEAPDSDQNWNALSLPFAVGPKGRIGKLNPAVIKP